MGLKIAVYLAFMCTVNALVAINVIDKDKVAEVTGNSLVECNERDCNAMCRDDHNTAGWCVDGKCSCNNAPTTASNSDTVDVGCSLRACEQTCRVLGVPRGTCVGDKCECDNIIPFKGVAASDSHAVVGGCDFLACEQLCRRLGFPGGACVGDKCQCDNFQPTEKVENDCSANCLMVCQKLQGGYKYGVCDANRRCSCKNEDSGFKFFEFKTSSIIIFCVVLIMSIICQCCKDSSKRAGSSAPK